MNGKTHCVYIAKFPNGKRYVGLTNDFENRKRQHLQEANGTNKYPFYNAIRKHGLPEWNILADNLTPEQAAELEIDTIACLKTMCSDGTGYNQTKGGEFKIKSKDIFVYTTYGRFVGIFQTQPEIVKALQVQQSNVSHCLAGRLPDTGGYYFSHTEGFNAVEHNKLHGKAKGKWFSVHTLDGEYVGEWSSTAKCAKALGLKHYSPIGICLRRGYAKHQNWRFKYIEIQ